MEENKKNNESENKKQHRIANISVGVIVGILLGTTVYFGASYANEVNKEAPAPSVAEKYYTVSYVYEDQVIYSESVKEGNNVSSVPGVPTTEGYDSTWSNDGTNVTSDLVITVVNTPKTYNIYYLTNFVQSFNLVKDIYCNDFIIYGWDGRYGYNNFYVKQDSYNSDEKSFTLYNDVFYFNDSFTEVYEQDHSTLVTSVDEYGHFEVYFRSFELNSNHTELYLQDNYKIDDKGLVDIDGVKYRHNGGVDTFVKADTNEDITKNAIYHEYASGCTYDKSTNKVVFDGETEEIEVVNGAFKYNNEDYRIYPETMIFYTVSNEEAGYKTGYEAPTKVTYTYGEDVVLSAEECSHIKNIKTSGNQITTTQDEYDMYSTRVPGMYRVILDRFGLKVTSTDKETIIYNPLGDIYVCAEFAPPSI